MFFKRLDYKYYFVIVMSYALLLTLAIGCIFMQSDRVYKQLEFYDCNSYQYVYEFRAPIGQNDYLNCTSVYFYSDSNTTRPILGDSFMTLEGSNYDHVTPFSTSVLLGEREIAVSYNLAKKYGLDVGSTVYSNHVIKNQILSYTVAEILPVCYGISRVDFDMNYGVILLGYDEDYQKNTDYTYTAFCEEMPNTSSPLVTFSAKDSHKEPLVAKAIAWQGILSVLTAGLTVLYVLMHSKSQKAYYSRLYLCGCPAKRIKKQLFTEIMLPGLAGQCIALLLSIPALSIKNAYFSYKTSLISICVSFAFLICSSAVTMFKGRKI